MVAKYKKDHNKRLILIVTVGRSGSRWLAEIFNSHDRIIGSCERDNYAEQFFKYVKWNELSIDLTGVFHKLAHSILNDWEDADLCRRLRGLGHTIRYVPRARVMHRVGGSSSTVPELAIRSFHESAYLYYVKHVARARFHPARWFARLTLRLRMLWRLRAAKALPKPSEHQDADQ